MFILWSEVVSWSSLVSDDLVQNVDKQFVKDGALQFCNFCLNFLRFHALFPLRISHARLSQVLT